MNQKVIYYDTETTGIKPDKERIVEIAAYDPLQNKEFVSFVNPGIPIPLEASAIHHITNEMVADASDFSVVGRQFIDFCGPNAILIAHNNDAFDLLFLKAEYARSNIAMPNWQYIDTLKWSRRYRKDLPRHSLQFLREIFGIPPNQAHRALDDVKVLYAVFQAMVDDLTMEQVYTLLYHPTSSLPEMNHMPFGKYQGQALELIPRDYLAWLHQSGALDKPDNAELKAALKKKNLLTPAKPRTTQTPSLAI